MLLGGEPSTFHTDVFTTQTTLTGEPPRRGWSRVLQCQEAAIIYQSGRQGNFKLIRGDLAFVQKKNKLMSTYAELTSGSKTEVLMQNQTDFSKAQESTYIFF